MQSHLHNCVIAEAMETQDWERIAGVMSRLLRLYER